MKHKLKKMLLASIAAVTLMAGSAKAQNWEITKSYNAVQVGMTDEGDARVRNYTNVGVKNDSVKLGFSGLNELGKDYVFGRNTFKMGLEKVPGIEAIVTSRIAGGSLDDIDMIDLGAGLRFNIGKAPVIDYGWADVVLHSGKGASGYDGTELVLFGGKQIGEGALEATLSVKETSEYLEIEGLTPEFSVGNKKLRGFGRIEMPNIDVDSTSVIAGIQLNY